MNNNISFISTYDSGIVVISCQLLFFQQVYHIELQNLDHLLSLKFPLDF